MNALLQIGLTNAVLATGLAALAAAAGKLCRRPALAHALWLLVLVKLVTPPLVVIPIMLPAPIDEPASADVGTEQPLSPQDAAQDLRLAQLDVVPPAQLAIGPPRLPEADDAWAPGPQPLENFRVEPTASLMPVSTAAANPIQRIADLPWRETIGIAWLGGSIAWFTVALVRIRRFQRLLRAGQAGPTQLQREASDLAVRLGLRDCPGVWMVPGVVSPLLWAVAGFPKLLLPAKLFGRLDPIQCRTLLAHELAHYRRRDHWVRCLEFAALGLYWWFPVAWWARRELREAEEECCDAWVLWTLPDAAKAYASALVETLDFLSGTQAALPPVASGLGQLDLLRRRLTMIMRGTVPHKLGGAGFLAVLGLGALLIPLWPTWAQQTIVVRTADAQQGDAASEPAQDVQKAKAELERATAELRLLQAQFETIRAALEDKSDANQRLLKLKRIELLGDAKAKEVQLKRDIQFSLEALKLNPAHIVVDRFFVGGEPGIEKRLSDLEKKLDQVLKEIRDMRKSMGGGSLQVDQRLLPGNNDQLSFEPRVVIVDADQLQKLPPKKDNPR